MGVFWCDEGTDSFLNILDGVSEALVAPEPFAGKILRVVGVREADCLGCLYCVDARCKKCPAERSRGDWAGDIQVWRRRQSAPATGMSSAG